MKTVLALLLAACTGNGWAQIVSRDSVHLKPLGTVVRGSFILVNKVVPLPEGDFTLAVVNTGGTSQFGYGDYARQGHKMVDVVVMQLSADKKVRAAVGARTVLAWGGGRREWTDEPCKGDRVVLYRLNQVPFMKQNYEQNCLIVNRTINSLGPQATGPAFVALGKWLREQGGTTPIPLVVDATITRIAVGDFLIARYGFDPAAYGCDGRDENSPFIKDVIEIGKVLQSGVAGGFGGRAIAQAAPRLPGCGEAAGRPVTPTAVPAKPGRPGSVAERLKALDSLRDQGLITPAEYAERRQKILDSL